MLQTSHARDVSLATAQLPEGAHQVPGASLILVTPGAGRRCTRGPWGQRATSTRTHHPVYSFGQRTARTSAVRDRRATLDLPILRRPPPISCRGRTRHPAGKRDLWRNACLAAQSRFGQAALIGRPKGRTRTSRRAFPSVQARAPGTARHTKSIRAWQLRVGPGVKP